MKKTVSALALAGSLAFLGVGGAQANHDSDYPSAPVTGTVSDGTVAAGETFFFSGTGFNAGEPIDLEVSREEAGPSAAGAPGTAGGPSAASPAGRIVPLEMVISTTTSADAAGNFSYPFKLEQDGLYTMTATGVESGHVVTAQVVVGSGTDGVAVAEGPGTGFTIGIPLANTGLHSGMLIWGAAGISALVLGAGTVAAAKRRASVTA